MSANYSNSVLLSKDQIIDEDLIGVLLNVEEDDLAPCDTLSDEEIEDFVKSYTGKTVWEYCVDRYPDAPDVQFNMVLKQLLK